MSSRLDTIKPYLALLVVSLVWGGTTGGIRLGVDTIPSALLPCARFLIAGLLLIAFCLFRGERLPRFSELKIQMIIGAVLLFGGNTAVCWTVKHMTTGFSAILVATTPLWMTLLSAILPPREKVPFLALIGIMIGFVGMVILLSPRLNHIGETNPVFWWSMAGLAVMTFCFALGSIYARKHPTPNSSLFMSVGVQNVTAGLMLVPVCFATIHNWADIHPSTQSLSALAYLIFLGTIIATPCYLYMVKTLPVSVSSTFAYITPVITVILGTLFLGEPVGPTMVTGASVIFVGVLLVQVISPRWRPGSTVQMPVFLSRWMPRLPRRATWP